jgi:probable phosphoglycerate mutase
MALHATLTPFSKTFPVRLSNEFSDKISGEFAGNFLGQNFKGKPLIFLLRHGRIQEHEQKRFIGQTNVLLDTLGREQGLFWQTALADIKFDAVYSSALKRCADTALLACPHQNPCLDSRLNEIHMGTWDGKSFDEIRESMPGEFERRGRNMNQFRPPGGESFQDVADRVLPFLDEVQNKQSGPILVVTHAGVIRVILNRLMDPDPNDLFKIKIEYGQLSVISSKKTWLE